MNNFLSTQNGQSSMMNGGDLGQNFSSINVNKKKTLILVLFISMISFSLVVMHMI
jgi:hypothetical protein